MEQYPLHEEFKISQSELENREQVFYGRIISNAESKVIFVYWHLLYQMMMFIYVCISVWDPKKEW